MGRKSSCSTVKGSKAELSLYQIKHCDMNEYKESETQLQPFLTSALDVDK
jgi:hypothetical protein